MRRLLRYLLILSWFVAAPWARVYGQAFDLVGPKVDVHVKRGTVTLPISSVPTLLPGDRLWIHPDLPETQSEHFVLVVAFLRGSTNPPPPEWFTRVETWTRAAHDEGVFVNVPAEAEQALLFLAPATGGGFNTLRNAVHDRPGSFVRAAQDLQAASRERMRLEVYLNDVKVTSQADPKELKTRAEMAARSLGIKINESCFQKPPEEQAPCLSQNSAGMVLDDAGAQSRVNQLANGNTMDLVNQLSYSTMAGGGAYSAYVGAIVDTAKILSSLHTAHYQYIPALALPTTDTLNLRLNMPPSFRDPKSVVVMALPPVGPAQPEPLYAINPGDSYCATLPSLVLPAGGAPMVFATPIAHNLFLHVEPQSGAKNNAVDIPVKADAAQGGLVLEEKAPALPPGALTAELRGKWGFDDWVGPVFHLDSPEQGKWAVAPGDHSALVVGREDTLHLTGANTQCVEKIEAQVTGASGDGSPAKLPFTTATPGTLEIKVPLDDAAPGPVSLNVHQYGLAEPDRIEMTAYEAAASLHSLTLSAGDTEALLKGTRLDQVARARLHGINLAPVALSRVEDMDQLALKADDATSNLAPGKSYTAEVELKDGRKLKTPATVEPPRPRIVLLSKGVQDLEQGSHSLVKLGSADDLPVDGKLVFFLRSAAPPAFPRNQKIELAATDASFDTMLTLADGSLVLEDAQTAEATVEPIRRFGLSAFGPVQVRAVAADGLAGDWVPLGTLVRLPGFKDLRCPHSAKQCILSGTNLFLIASISATPGFDAAKDVPPEFTGAELLVPHPGNGALYLKLRDDPDTVQTLTMPVTAITPAAVKAAAPTAQPSAATPVTAPENPPATAVPQSAAPANVAEPVDSSGTENSAPTQ